MDVTLSTIMDPKVAPGSRLAKIGATKQKRLEYLLAALGDEADQFSDETLKLASDGVYYLLPHHADELVQIAHLLAANPHVTLARLGRGTKLAKYVQQFRQENKP